MGGEHKHLKGRICPFRQRGIVSPTAEVQLPVRQNMANGERFRLGGADLYQPLKTARPKDSQHPGRLLSWVSIVSRHCLINTQLSWLLWAKN